MRIAVAQLTTGSDPTRNLEIVEQHARDASAGGAHIVVFPEATMCAFGNDLAAVVEPLHGPWASRVRELATDLGIVIVAGMFTPGEGGRVRNTLLVVGPGVDTSYDKVHLFDAFGYRESDTVEPGTHPVTFDVHDTTVGLATCYDIRFPALFTETARRGAQITIVCASWGAGKGKVDQWSLLARARALDSTTFIVACGQADPMASGGVPSVRTAPTGVGHSVVVSPLGRVLLELGPEPRLGFVDIDPEDVAEARRALPVLENARSFSGV